MSIILTQRRSSKKTNVVKKNVLLTDLQCFYNDYDDISYVLDKHVVLFRMSFYKSSKKNNY